MLRRLVLLVVGGVVDIYLLYRVLTFLLDLLITSFCTGLLNVYHIKSGK